MTLKTILLTSTAAAILLAGAMSATAAGIAAETPVNNTVSLSYDSDSGTISLPTAASSTFLVDEKIDFTLVAQDGTSVTVNPTESEAALTFLLTNEGNDTRDFDINIVQSDNGDPISLTYDATNSGAAGTWSLYTSPNASGGPDTGYNPTGFAGVGDLAPDAQVYIRIVAHIPSGATQGQEDVFSVTAQPLNGAKTAAQAESVTFTHGATEIIWGDTGADGFETTSEYFIVHSALVKGTKSVSVISENRDGSFSCAFQAPDAGAPFDAFIPGACLEYLIVLENDPTALENADSFTFSDVLPAGVTLISTRDNVGFDSISVNVGTNTVTGTVNSMVPGGTASVKIRAQID